MAALPNIKSYVGTLSSSPVVINPQADAGFVADFIQIIPNNGSPGLIMTLSNGVTIPVLTGTSMRLFNGPYGQFQLESMSGSVDYVIYCSQGVGQSPAVDVIGNSSPTPPAPNDAKFLLWEGAVPGSLTGAVSAANLNVGTLPFNLLYNDAAGTGKPIELRVTLNPAADFTAGGGVGLKFQAEELSGDHDFGELAFLKNSGTSTDLNILGFLGFQIAKFTGELLGSDPASGLELTGAGNFGASPVWVKAVQQSLYLDTPYEVFIRSYGTEFCKFNNTTQHFLVDAQIEGDGSIAIFTPHNKDLSLSVGAGETSLTLKPSGLIQVAANTTIQPVSAALALLSPDGLSYIQITNTGATIHTAAGDWVFATSGKVLAAGQIKGLTAGTDADDAVTVDQLGTTVADYLPLAGGTMAGDIVMGANAITGLVDGTNPQDAATVAQLTAGLAAQTKSGQTSITTTGSGQETITGLGDWNGAVGVVCMNDGNLTIGGANPCYVCAGVVTGGSLTVSLRNAITNALVVPTNAQIVHWIVSLT